MWKLSSEQCVGFPKCTRDESISGPSGLNRKSCRTRKEPFSPMRPFPQTQSGCSALQLLFCYFACFSLPSDAAVTKSASRVPTAPTLLPWRQGMAFNLRGLLLITLGKKRGVGKWGIPLSFHCVNWTKHVTTGEWFSSSDCFGQHRTADISTRSKSPWGEGAAVLRG